MTEIALQYRTMERSSFKEILQIISEELAFTEEQDLALCEWGSKVKKVAVRAFDIGIVGCPMSQLYGGFTGWERKIIEEEPKKSTAIAEFPHTFDKYMSIRLDIEAGIDGATLVTIED